METLVVKFGDLVSFLNGEVTKNLNTSTSRLIEAHRGHPINLDKVNEEYPNSHLVLLVCKGATVGILRYFTILENYLKPMDLSEDLLGYRYVNMVHIHHDYRGRGLSKMLFEKLHTIDPVDIPIILEVSMQNAVARSLYAKMGYKEIAKKELYDEIVMCRGCSESKKIESRDL